MEEIFFPKTKLIRNLVLGQQRIIEELEKIFYGKTHVYIDYANVLPWSKKLGWHIDLERLYQFFGSFKTIQCVKFYYGTLLSEQRSINCIQYAKNCGYEVITKPVKIMRFSIDASSVPINAPALLESFISKSLLNKFDLETIEFLNEKLRELNKKGLRYLEDRKCNFDVEIGRDILLDEARNGVDSFVLWSGDSDFADPIRKLLRVKKRVTLFATARRVSRELSLLGKEGLFIFDIQKIGRFICRNGEMQKGSHERTPKL